MTNAPDENDTGKLTSEELAALIIDALMRASVVRPNDVEQAVKIATEEIEARKGIGDY